MFGDCSKFLAVSDPELYLNEFFFEVIHKSDVGKDATDEFIRCIQHRFDTESGGKWSNMLLFCLPTP